MKQNSIISKQKTVQFNLVMNILVTILNVMFPLISFPYVSRILNPTGMGRVTYMTSVISYFQLFAVLGINTYGIKVCAENRDDKRKLSIVFKELMTIIAITTFIAYMGVVLLYFMFYRNSEYKIIYWISASAIFFQMIGVEWLFKAQEQYTYIAIRSFGIKIISLILMFVLIKKSTDYVYYAAIIVFANGAAYILNFIKSREYIDYQIKDKLYLKRHLAPMFTFFITNIIHLVYTNLDILMLEHSKGDYEVGLYNAALRIENILLSVVTALGAVVLPKISIALKNNNIQEFNRVNKEAVNFIMILGTFLVGIFELCADECILILGGEQYIDSIVLLKTLLPIILIAGVANISGVQALIPMNKERFFMISVVLGAITDFVLNLILLPSFGAKATAFSTLMAEFIVLVMQLIYLKKLNVKILSRDADYMILIVGIISTISSYVSTMLINADNVVLNLIIKCVIFSVIFVITSSVLKVKTYERYKKILLSNMLQNIKRSNN